VAALLLCLSYAENFSFAQPIRFSVRILQFWIDRGTKLVEGTERACAVFDATEAELHAALAELEPKDDTPPRPVAVMLSAQHPPRATQATSYTSFDPFSPDVKAPDDGVVVSKHHAGGTVTSKRKVRR
jgi:hypothetical protein